MKSQLFLLLLVGWMFGEGSTRAQAHNDDKTRSDSSRPAGLLEEMKRKNVKGIYLFGPQTNLDSFFAYCREVPIDIISTSDAYYKNNDFLEKVEENDIALNLNFPVYFDQSYLDKHPEHYAIDSRGQKAVHSWLHFACPSQPAFLEHRKKQLLKMLVRTQPEMVSFDFIRFFVFWEKVYPNTSLPEIVDGCYCQQCIRNFEEYSGITVKDPSSQWIKANALTEWTDWKCHTIEQTLKTLVAVVNEYDETLPIAVKLVPWREQDFNGAIRAVAGQDIDRLKAYTDIFIAMTYSHMLKRDPEWIHSVAEEIHTKTGKPVITSVEVAATYVKEKIPDKEFEDMLLYGNMKPSNGIILFHYGYINSH